jgi:hypothetical protein
MGSEPGDQSMFTSHRFAWLSILLWITVLFSWPVPVCGQPSLPDFSSAVFTDSLNIDNPYFVLVPGTTFHYEGETTDPESGEVETETVIVEVLNETRTVLGVSSRVVRDRVYSEGLLMEDTFDWFAQDYSGNVWYMGEDVTDFEYDEDGNLVGTSHEGAWEAGVNDALPGILMNANPQIGDHYYQEFYPGVAEDEGEVIGIDEMATVPFGTFDDVLQTRDTTALEPDALEHKFYAPGVGLILERAIDPESGEVTGTLELVSVVPEATGSLAWGLLVFVVGFRRRQ